MNALKGKVRGGRIEVDASLPEWAEVVVLVGGGEDFTLNDEDLQELEERAAEADAGLARPIEPLLARLRAR